MKIEELLRLKNILFEESNKLSQLKGRGYGTESDTLLNLKLVEYAGVVDSETGAWVRLSDKVMRLGRILKHGEEFVGFEGFVDTVIDGINYLTMIVALRYEKDEKFREKFDKMFGGGVANG